MKKMVAYILSFLFIPGAFAAPPPNFDAVQFQALLVSAQIEGVKKSLGGEYEYRFLARNQGEATDPEFSVGAFALLGTSLSPNEFRPMTVSVVAEYWKKMESGHWQMEEWLWTSSLDGELLGVEHARSDVDADGVVVSKEMLPTDPEDSPIELQRWSEQLQTWYGFHP